jgi:hypothetical protein
LTLSRLFLKLTVACFELVGEDAALTKSKEGDISMKIASLFVAGLAVAILSNASAHAAQGISDTSSFPTAHAPWVGYSWNGFSYVGCRNRGPGGVPYKTYTECMESGQKNGWRINESAPYCSAISYKQ